MIELKQILVAFQLIMLNIENEYRKEYHEENRNKNIKLTWASEIEAWPWQPTQEKRTA